MCHIYWSILVPQNIQIRKYLLFPKIFPDLVILNFPVLLFQAPIFPARASFSLKFPGSGAPSAPHIVQPCLSIREIFFEPHPDSSRNIQADVLCLYWRFVPGTDRQIYRIVKLHRFLNNGRLQSVPGYEYKTRYIGVGSLNL